MRQYNLLFGLKLCERVLKETDNLSKTLQLQSLSADESQCLEEMTCLTLRGMKTEQAFDLFFQRLELLLHQASVAEPSLPRSRKLPKWLEYGDGEAFHSSTVEEHYRRKYFEVLDLEVCSITTQSFWPTRVHHLRKTWVPAVELFLQRRLFSWNQGSHFHLQRQHQCVRPLHTTGDTWNQLLWRTTKSHNPRCNQVSAELVRQPASPPQTGVLSWSPASCHASNECH